MAMEKKRKPVPGTSRLWAIVQEHIDAQAPYQPSRRQVAKYLGVSPQTLTNWYEGLSGMPSREHMMAVARGCNIPYAAVLRAALIDANLDEESEGGSGPDGPIDLIDGPRAHHM